MFMDNPFSAISASSFSWTTFTYDDVLRRGSKSSFEFCTMSSFTCVAGIPVAGILEPPAPMLTTCWEEEEA